MKILFRFNSRSSGQDVPEAISIAQKCGGRLENRFYVIEFDDPRDENLEHLSALVGHLKGSAISIDGEGPIKASNFFRAVYCTEKLLCKGICKHVRISYTNLDSFLIEKSRDIEDNVLVTSDQYLVESLSYFLEMEEENQFKFNKELYFENFHRATEMEEKFCEKYDIVKIENEIMKLPDEVKFVSSEEYFEEYQKIYEEEEEEQKYRDQDIIAMILANAEISSQISVNDTLECAKASCMLLRREIGISVQNSGVLIYYIPYIDKYILAKLKELEDLENDVNNEASENNEINLIIEKKNEFFYVSDPYYELYYKLYDDDINKLIDGLITLKNI